VPSKIRPDDWDRLFAPNARRRGGPLRALLNLLIPVVILGLLGVGAVYALDFRQQRVAQAIATATAQAPTEAAIRAATAQVKLNATATIAAALTATGVAKQPTATPEGILTARVFNGGNVREVPVSGRPLDQVNAGETVQLVAKNQDSTWFKVTYGREGRTVIGWVSGTLLTIEPSVAQAVPVGQ
jgi:Tfp pilus assembly protein PilX